jgi:hypothetical protein
MSEDDRYAPNWSTTSRKARRDCPTCCWCKSRPATETHHAYYYDRHGEISGREVPGIDVFPVCEECHGILHQDAHWFAPGNPRSRRNFEDTVIKLRDGWTQLVGSRWKTPVFGFQTNPFGYWKSKS